MNLNNFERKLFNEALATNEYKEMPFDDVKKGMDVYDAYESRLVGKVVRTTHNSMSLRGHENDTFGGLEEEILDLCDDWIVYEDEDGNRYPAPYGKDFDELGGVFCKDFSDAIAYNEYESNEEEPAEEEPVEEEIPFDDVKKGMDAYGGDGNVVGKIVRTTHNAMSLHGPENDTFGGLEEEILDLCDEWVVYEDEDRNRYPAPYGKDFDELGGVYCIL